MKTTSLFLSLAPFLSLASGFVVRPGSVHPTPSLLVAPLRSRVELSNVDEMCIENVAEFCLTESCELEEYEALINQLQDQRDLISEHVSKIDGLLAKLRDHDADQ
uniref:Uncharacterized protein n=1 Tax=Trieres chinensis TaxID=1514140 RepID=A0A7S1Z6Z4_TRICV|mmetsp:Transcript_18770/g.38094  ORF Transcript_18770/g.38094 Transcript_18770/m.38094 type:complete len:105 (+) Transcript_18770:167-481(+)|eukprot:CAMPEP_0183291418 /NCGR_PEP_ID=MMETSP0160_2-20130417/849_1 /TAXON_ID=2839 ORGANISM="Odontella Sinensis, Strain Grunow 1884" /NCGR_SAMPLE_ID=MMETSP0160_2 /ASSEMBLY_ACC=CAM_ASM_000250 /LENGTH=104 /DNA_ID=CAMNT_0025452223 /DNA_START=167 /DNA_END=481 /DNA_ORIENTATION=+